MDSAKKVGLNIRSKVLLILCIVLSLTVVGNYVISGQIFENAQITSFNNEAFATSRGLQNNLNNLIEKSFLSYTEISNCQPLLDSFVEDNENVLYAYTTDKVGAPLYMSEDAKQIGAMGLLDSNRLFECFDSAIGSGHIIDDESKNLYYILPLRSVTIDGGKEESAQVGFLVVAYPGSCITEPLDRLNEANSALAIVTFVTTLLLAVLMLTKWITKPLQKLDLAIRKVSRNGFLRENSLEINTGDEIGQIAHSFNEMLAKLDETTVSKSYVDSILLNMSEVLFVINLDKCIETVNDAATSLLGYEPEEMIGQHMDMLYADAKENVFNSEDFHRNVMDNLLRNNETEFVTKEGNVIDVSVNWSTLKDEAGNVNKYVCTARDVTEIKKAQSIVTYQANYDELTGLFNRYNLENAIEKILNDEGRTHFFIVMDLDKFKAVNDTCGHTAGDKLLKQIAYMIKTSVRETDLVARLGGDEFAVVMYDTDIETVTDAMEGLAKSIENYDFKWEEKVLNVGISIGAFEINRAGLDRLTVFNSADRACYIAKTHGGNRLHIYTDSDKTEDVLTDASMVQIVNDAFENGRFFLEYQPIVPLDETSDLHMYEVLLRLRTADGTVLKPGTFLSTVERCNKLLPLDRWVIHSVCEDYYNNMEKLSLGKDVQFNINLTRGALESGYFFEYVCQEFEKFDIPPQAICFELSESFVMSNFAEVTDLMDKFRSVGCRFAIDNLKLGMSSLMYLRILAADTIKIDGGFVSELAKSDVNMSIVKCINEIAHLLNIKNVAEWVEDKDVLAKIKELGVDYAQGYEIMKPGALEDVIKK